MPKWFWKFVELVILLVLPPSSLPFIQPYLTVEYWLQFPSYSYMRGIFLIVYIMLWVADYTGMVYLIVKWIRGFNQ